jgi:hypothetical protein
MSAKSVDISARAYTLWEQAGCPEGRALDNWLQAEAELSKAAKEDRPEMRVSKPGRGDRRSRTARR